MSTRTIRLPDIGEGITEAEIVEWLVGVGDTIAEDQVIGSVMTDKAAVEIPSPVAGVVESLSGEIGDVIAVGAELVRIRSGGREHEGAAEEPATVVEADGGVDADEDAAGPAAPEHSSEAPPEAPPEASSKTAARSEPQPEVHPEANPEPEREPSFPPRGGSVTPSGRSASGGKPIASPAVRRRAYRSGVPLADVRGTGPGGRILQADLERHPAHAATAGTASSSAAAGASDASGAVEEIRVVGMRRAIARRMQDAKRRIPHFSYVEESDVTALETLRVELNERAAERYPRLTLLPFVVMAVVRAVADFPRMNARYDDEAEIVRQYREAHVGIATQTDAGLTVPVLRCAEAMDIRALAAAIARLAEAAREGGLGPGDMGGGTITVTSLGALGGLVSTPIINHPEVAIVGVNRIVTRPMFDGDEVVPRKLMNLSCSFDHRVVDGHDAARFVQRVRGFLEFPTSLFVPV